MLNCLFVGIGGFIGAVLRYLVGLIPAKSQSGFPIKTLAINVVGALLISLIAAAAAKNKDLDPRLILFLKVGVCGGFTTFSTFAYESYDLMQGGQALCALGYMLASVVLGIGAVFVGQLLLR